MDNSIFYTYYQLSLDNIVEPIKCIITDHELPLYPFMEMDREDFRMKLECLECNYKIYPGLDSYDMMKKAVLENE